MANIRPRQFIIGLLAVLSLFAAPLSACVCSHHQIDVSTEAAACDHHPVESAKHSNSKVSNLLNVLQSDEDCVCIQPSSKALAKSENIKLKKHAEAPSALPAVEILAFRKVESPAIGISGPLANLEDFNNFKPSRGPPRS